MAKSFTVGEGNDKKTVATSKCFNLEQTGGRPRKIINDLGLSIVESLAKIQCTEEEIAAVLEVSVDTLHEPHNKAAFTEAVKRGKLEGRVSFRRMQYKKAQGGSTTMQIWLGKQYLDQKDKVDLKTDESQLAKLDDILSKMQNDAEAGLSTEKDGGDNG